VTAPSISDRVSVPKRVVYRELKFGEFATKMIDAQLGDCHVDPFQRLGGKTLAQACARHQSLDPFAPIEIRSFTQQRFGAPLQVERLWLDAGFVELEGSLSERRCVCVRKPCCLAQNLRQ
jgi:hypothetical protein